MKCSSCSWCRCLPARLSKLLQRKFYNERKQNHLNLHVRCLPPVAQSSQVLPHVADSKALPAVEILRQRERLQTCPIALNCPAVHILSHWAASAKPARERALVGACTGRVKVGSRSLAAVVRRTSSAVDLLQVPWLGRRKFWARHALKLAGCLDAIRVVWCCAHHGAAVVGALCTGFVVVGLPRALLEGSVLAPGGAGPVVATLLTRREGRERKVRCSSKWQIKEGERRIPDRSSPSSWCCCSIEKPCKSPLCSWGTPHKCR